MPSKNTFVLNPKTQTYVYDLVPEITFKHDRFEAGEIKLRYGEHTGPNRGFGVAQIWAEHSKELEALGYQSIDKVANYISDIIVAGTPIFCEFNDPRGNHRIAVLKTSKGVAYLEKKYDGHNNVFYSVVTAFRKNKAHGTRIGSVC